MKKWAPPVVALCLIVLVALAVEGAGDKKAPNTEAATFLPSSLDNLYPPNAPGPMYLLAMFDMATPFSGIVSDLFEGDMANSHDNFEKFREQYIAVSKMVPEWETRFPIGPIDALAQAMKTENPGMIMPAIDNVGVLCHNCHVLATPAAQHRYSWGDFGMITVTDPITGTDYPFARFKLMMETDFSAIGTDLKQGQPENARQRLAGFEKRFTALKEVCSTCHDTERKYFVDDNITGMIGQLKAKLGEPNIDPQAVGRLLQGIGQESCTKCHLVHVPAAYAKSQLTMK